MSGRPKPKVLPVPVLAWPMMSWPERAEGDGLLLDGEGVDDALRGEGVDDVGRTPSSVKVVKSLPVGVA